MKRTDDGEESKEDGEDMDDALLILMEDVRRRVKIK